MRLILVILDESNQGFCSPMAIVFTVMAMID